MDKDMIEMKARFTYIEERLNALIDRLEEEGIIRKDEIEEKLK